MNERSPDPVDREPSDTPRRSSDRPTHPALPATLLMIGVVLLIVFASAVSVLNR